MSRTLRNYVLTAAFVLAVPLLSGCDEIIRETADLFDEVSDRLYDLTDDDDDVGDWLEDRWDDIEDWFD